MYNVKCTFNLQFNCNDSEIGVLLPEINDKKCVECKLNVALYDYFANFFMIFKKFQCCALKTHQKYCKKICQKSRKAFVPTFIQPNITQVGHFQNPIHH